MSVIKGITFKRRGQVRAVSSELSSKLRASRAASIAASRSHYVNEWVRPTKHGLYTASQWRYKRAVERAAVPSLDICTYQAVTENPGEVEANAVLYPGGVKVNGRYQSRSGAAGGGGGRRGVVSGKSRQSRRRQLEMLMKIRPATETYFVTLTNPDDVLDRCGSVQGVYDDFNRNLDTLERRFYREFPGASLMWAKEEKPRLSGEHVGQIFPHAHMLAFNVYPDLLPMDDDLLPGDENKTDNALRLQRWFKDNWADIVASNDENHRRRGADVQDINSRKKAFGYITKYMGKSVGAVYDRETGEVIKTGRMWGMSHGPLAKDADGQPKVLHPGVNVGIADTEMPNLKRLVKRWLKAIGQKSGNKRGERYGQWLASRSAYKKSWSVFGFLGLDDLTGADLFGGDDRAAIGRFFEVLSMCGV